MSPLNHIRTKNNLAPPIFYVAKNWNVKERVFPVVKRGNQTKVSKNTMLKK